MNLFKHSIVVQQYLKNNFFSDNHSNLYNGINRYKYVIIVSSTYILIFLNLLNDTTLLLILSIITCVFTMVTGFYNTKVLTTIRGFLFFNLVYGAYFIVLTFCVLNVFTDSRYIVNGLCYIIYLLFWNFMSIIANSKVSTISNSCISITLTLTLAGFDYFTYFFREPIHLHNIGFEKVKLILFLLLVVNGTSTAMAIAKGYWVEKYNFGKEISWIDFLTFEQKEQIKKKKILIKQMERAEYHTQKQVYIVKNRNGMSSSDNET